MEHAVRRFARKILLVHLGLLLAVLALVAFASRAIRQSARDQALRQAQSRQQLLADQTARAIGEFYGSILSDLDLLPPAENLADEAALVNGLTGRARVKAPLAQRRNQLGPLLARQLEERVEYLFVFDKIRHAAFDVSRAEGTPDPARPNGPEDHIAKAYESWLKTVDGPAISPFQMVGEKGSEKGMNLVCQPLPRLSAVLVAAVSVEKINGQYLKLLNDDPQTGAFLVNDSLTVMAASRPKLVGASLAAAPDPRVKAAVDAFAADAYHGTRVLDQPFTLAAAGGAEKFEPAVVTAVPIQVPGKRWFVLISSPLSDVDSVVGSLFHRIALWAAFVVVAMTGILVSTAVQMIRGRVKLERVRHEVFKREVERARQIQRAWLPRAAPTSRLLDVAAVNYPAQHISGDFYNWFDLPGGRTAVVIGDVTGHGMSAAFLMATTQLLVRTTLERINDPGRCLTEVNRQLCTQVFNGQFVTMQVLVVDPAARAVELSTAGHPPPLLAEGSAPGAPAAAFKPLSLEPQLVLGVDADTVYETEHVDLPPGAVLLLYTDGAADVQAPDGRRFGNDGLRRSLSLPPAPRDAPAGDALALLEGVVGAVNAFRGTQDLGDDLTLVAVRFRSVPRPVAKRAEPAAALPG